MLCFFSATPFGQLPVLFIDEEPLSGSQAIARYLGEKYSEFMQLNTTQAEPLGPSSVDCTLDTL